MSVGGSQQLRIYRRARRDGVPIDLAAERAGMSLSEARSWDEDDAANPPPPKAYELLRTTIPELAGSANTSEETAIMARGKQDEVTEVKTPDFKKMKRIFTNDITPTLEKNAKTRGDLSAAWKMIEDDCHLNKRAAKLLHKLHGESEETRDDFLRTLYGGMQALGIGISRDLVDRMTDDDAPTMPIVEVRGMGTESLATVQ